MKKRTVVGNKTGGKPMRKTRVGKKAPAKKTKVKAKKRNTNTGVSALRLVDAMKADRARKRTAGGY